MKKRLEKKHLQKTCTVCGKKIKLIVYPSRAYRGGHYFGKIPLYREGAYEQARKKYGTKKVELRDGFIIDMLKKDPKPYGYAEYWECPKCYWRY